MGGFQRLQGSFLRMLRGPQRQLRVFWGANDENGLRSKCGMRLKWANLGLKGANSRIKGAYLVLKIPT